MSPSFIGFYYFSFKSIKKLENYKYFNSCEYTVSHFQNSIEILLQKIIAESGAGEDKFFGITYVTNECCPIYFSPITGLSFDVILSEDDSPKALYCIKEDQTLSVIKPQLPTVHLPNTSYHG